jgi:hypothetical protein
VSARITILYMADESEPVIMTLVQLIKNFNETDGWTVSGRVRHNANDLRYDLLSRGWYEGDHDNGRYLVLNLAKTNLHKLWSADVCDQVMVEAGVRS